MPNLQTAASRGKAADVAKVMELHRKIAGMMPDESEPDAQCHFADERRPWDGRLANARYFIAKPDTTPKQARTIARKAIADVERAIKAYEASQARIVAKLKRERQERIDAKAERVAEREALRQRAIDAFPELVDRHDFIVVDPKLVDLESEDGQAAPPLVFWREADKPSMTNGMHGLATVPVPHDVKDKEGIFYSAPHDFWKAQPRETIGPGMLPKIIEDVAFETAARKGWDRDALAMTMLTFLSSVIATDIKVCNSADPDETFKESIRIWTALVGVAGSGKSPLLKMVEVPFEEIDRKLSAQHAKDMEAYKAMTKDEKKEEEPPQQRQLTLADASTEKAQVVFNNNQDGMLLLYDELVSFFGAKARYGKGSGGEQSALGFWLSVYDSRRYKAQRISRADVDCYPSGSIIGGIQPKMMDSLMDEDANNAGLVQRFNPVMMQESKPAPIESDEPAKYPMNLYWQLAKDVYYNCPLRLTGAELCFAKDALPIKKAMFDWVRKTVEEYRPIDDALASHINKFPGMFLRFCGLWHMIEHWSDKNPRLITKETAAKVYRFMTVARLSHAVAFFNKIRENKQTADMRGIAEFILQHELDSVSAREIQRGTNRFREISTRDIAHTAGNMVALGWLFHVVKKGRHDSFNWHVNDKVHQMFANHAVMARKKAAEAKETSDKIISEGGRRKRDET